MFPKDSLILVVDDSAVMRSVIKGYLEALGYSNIMEASDGNVAYNVLTKQNESKKPIQLVFSDWNMPEMSGLQLLKKVRTQPDWKKLPFVMITSEGNMKEVTDAVLAGVTNYIVKPVDQDILEKKMQDVWQKVSSGK